MNSDLFPLFRDKNGDPLTPRPLQAKTTTCADRSIRTNIVNPSESIMKSTGLGFEIVTPKVRAVARNQFNCQEVTGGRLENQPTAPDDCFGSHWDEVSLTS